MAHVLFCLNGQEGKKLFECSESKTVNAQTCNDTCHHFVKFL